MAGVVERRRDRPAVPVAEAVDGFLAATDLAAGTRAAYEGTLLMLRLGWQRAWGRRRCDPDARGPTCRATTRRRRPPPTTGTLPALSLLFIWCIDNDLVLHSPAKSVRSRKARRAIEAKRQRLAIPLDQLQARWSDPRYRLSNRVHWAMV